jgi:hypothetical protein
VASRTRTTSTEWRRPVCRGVSPRSTPPSQPNTGVKLRSAYPDDSTNPRRVWVGGAAVWTRAGVLPTAAQGYASDAPVAPPNRLEYGPREPAGQSPRTSRPSPGTAGGVAHTRPLDDHKGLGPVEQTGQAQAAKLHYAQLRQLQLLVGRLLRYCATAVRASFSVPAK